MKLLKELNRDGKHMICIIGLLSLLLVGIYAFSFVPVHYSCDVDGMHTEYYGMTKNIDLLLDTYKIYGTTTVVNDDGSIEIDMLTEATLYNSCVLIK